MATEKKLLKKTENHDKTLWKNPSEKPEENRGRKIIEIGKRGENLGKLSTKMRHTRQYKNTRDLRFRCTSVVSAKAVTPLCNL
jgi:hypothetical protein